MLKKNEIFKFDYTLLAASIILIVIGIISIYSAGFDPIAKINNGMYKKQLFWFIAGFVIMIGITFINYKMLGDYCHYIYIANLVVILFTLLFSTPIRNARAWIDLGLFSIQPSEFMKLSLVIMLAKYLEMREREIRNVMELIVPTIITMIPVILIVKQPDMGTALLFLPLLLIMLYAAGADAGHLISIVSISVISLTIPMFITYREWSKQDSPGFIIDLFNSGNALYVFSAVLFSLAIVMLIVNIVFVKRFLRKFYLPTFVISMGLFFSVLIQRHLMDYQKKRILIFLDPTLDPHGFGYNLIQAKIAIGSGGFFGKGFLRGTQTQLGFLPEKTSDFIFPVIAEEWGLIGALVVVFLFFLIIYEGFQIAINTKDKFSSLLAVGITSIIFLNFMINVGMVLGLAPCTGLPLSFVSYGGSNLLMCMIGLGILVSIQMRKTVN